MLLGTYAAANEILPAGTLLQCTIDEPNFSAKTAAIGDPLLCHLGYVSQFGHAVFPRGAYLAGHLKDYRDPGHFFGKGDLQVEFDRLILPGGDTLPLEAKLVSVPHYKVDRDGNIRGGGHAKRDALEWAFPLLWPVKLLTLPARGPYPRLKGEVRVTMRLMEDVEVPTPAATRASVPMPPWASPTRYRSPGLWRDPAVLTQASAVSPAPRLLVGDPVTATDVESSEPRRTLLALKDSTVLLASDYWLEADQLHCMMANSEEKLLPVDMLDLSETVRLNSERNVRFELHTKP
jgi:hypothetical protein